MIILVIIALVVSVVAIAQVSSLRRENHAILEELRGLRDAVDAFEAPARGESVAVAETDAPVETKTVPVVDSEIPEPILAVIAASVAGVIRGQYRILAIQAANAPVQVAVAKPDVAWTHEGWREIYSSHKIR